jgi:hypothetical protein
MELLHSSKEVSPCMLTSCRRSVVKILNREIGNRESRGVWMKIPGTPKSVASSHKPGESIVEAENESEIL